MRRIVVLTAVILTLMIVPTSIYALQNPRTSAVVKTPEEIALGFIKGSPTFKFDGMSSSLVVEDIYVNKSNPPQYVVTLSFQCMHSGYGERDGMILLQVITPHTAVVTIREGVILSAVIDGSWNEAAQRPVSNDDTKPIIEAIALDWLINAPTFKFDGIEGSVIVVDSWLAMTFAAPSFWGVTVEFDCLHAGYGDRDGEMLAQIITHHVARLHVTEGAVTFAEIDDAWDEVKQKPIEAAYTSEKAEVTALSWLYGCPTFNFDGIPETVKVKQVVTLRMMNAWEVYIEFTCGYPGYGNRTGRLMLGHSQSHIIRISVLEGQVTRATIDDQWDEIEQRPIEAQQTILTPEQARDIAILSFLASYDFDSATPTEWTIENLSGLLGHQTTRYLSGDWNVTVDYAVVWKPIYTVKIVKGDSSWKGTVDQNGAVTLDEKEPNTPVLIYTPDIARKLCLDYILTAHPEMMTGEIPIEWNERNLVPDGIVGATNIEYKSGTWTVTVSGPVVWKPTYEVMITHLGDGTSFTWKGIVPQGGPVQEISFNK